MGTIYKAKPAEKPYLIGHGDFRNAYGKAIIVLVVVPLVVLFAIALTGCSATVETDNTPWGKASIRTDAKPPPPIYSRTSRSTSTKPPPPAPEVEETTCENGVCGVPVR